MWMIKEFSFKNIGPFEDETKLELVARLNDDEKELIRIECFDRKILKFNKVVGIFGPNASGKTKILDAILFYLRYNSLDTDINFFTNFFYMINSKEKDFFVKAIITNGKEEIIHEIKFDPKVFFKATRQDLLSSINIRNAFSESINLLDLKSNTSNEIFDNGNDDLTVKKIKYKFIEKFNFNNNSFDNSKNERKEEVYKKYLSKFKEEKELNDLESLLDLIPSLEEQEKEERRVYEALDSVCQFEISNIHFLKQNYDFSSMDPRKFSQLITKLIKQGYSDKEISYYLTDIARICDRNLEEIKIKSYTVDTKHDMRVLKSNQEFNYSFSIKFFDNNWTHSFDNLSSGILNLFIIFLELLYLKKISNGHSLIIIDELGQSWHSTMTTNFINFLLESNMLNHSTLIFTSHQPEIGNFMRKDAVWIVDRNHSLKPLFTFKNPVTKTSISRQIFSKVYYDDIFDVFQTNPLIADFLESNVDSYFGKKSS